MDSNLKDILKLVKNSLVGFTMLMILGCSSLYYLDAPVSDPIMFADDGQDSDLCRAEDGGLAGSAGECPT